MIASFANTGTEDIYHLRVSKVALKTLPAELHRIAKRKLNIIALANHLKDLKSPPGNCLEQLKGKLADHHSIRINDQWRIIFIWKEGQAFEVQICDYH
jgi:proteic killer suppression protein